MERVLIVLIGCSLYDRRNDFCFYSWLCFWVSGMLIWEKGMRVWGMSCVGDEYIMVCISVFSFDIELNLKY